MKRATHVRSTFTHSIYRRKRRKDNQSKAKKIHVTDHMGIKRSPISDCYNSRDWERHNATHKTTISECTVPHQQFCTLLQWLIGWSVSVTAVVVQGPSYRLDIASAPQTAEDDDETKQPSDAECDDEVDEQPRNGKPANTETDAGWKSEVWLDFCETLYHIINL